MKTELSIAIKAEARRLGFDLVGVTTPDPPAHLDVYQRWLAAGRQAEMGYLANERARARRADPRTLLPECESILVLGMRYAPAVSRVDNAAPLLAASLQNQAISPAPVTGRVAAYAWGADYHELLPPRLQALVAFIEAQIGHPLPNRWYTDTGPLLERELAQRAGLGWIGKNTCLINPQRGSYFLLAEILLGLALPPDAPLPADHCGSCTRCLEACPTACILPDRTLDARRCISYLTIELKTAIPAELRAAIGDWVFGCDICQQVCPWNQRFADLVAPIDPALGPAVVQAQTPAGAASWPAPRLVEELELSTQAFNHKFKGSPLKRTKRRGYLRNVAVALGNLAERQYIPALAAALQDVEPLVRSHAAWALGQTGTDPAHKALQTALERELDPLVRGELVAALSNR